MADSEAKLDAVIDKLVKDVEAAVHALYRGDVRQQTVRVRSESHRKAAREALKPMLTLHQGGGAARDAAPPSPSGTPLSADEITAITRCVMAWLPMGAPSSATPDSRCVPAGRELVPSWADREKAREALRKMGLGK